MWTMSLKQTPVTTQRVQYEHMYLKHRQKHKQIENFKLQHVTNLKSLCFNNNNNKLIIENVTRRT